MCVYFQTAALYQGYEAILHLLSLQLFLQSKLLLSLRLTE
jgi:hypothetical protein